MKKLFGTDGVRGLANGLLTPELVKALECAVLMCLQVKYISQELL